MQPKHDLLVFSKREILTVLLLLMMVALLSFTIGLRLGRRLAVLELPQIQHVTQAIAEAPPLVAGGHEEVTEDNKEKDSHGVTETTAHGSSSEEHQSDAHSGDEHGGTKSSVIAATAASVENVADQKLGEEIKKENLKNARPVMTALPKERKGKEGQVGFTLQVGAYKTIAEASEQVTVLRRKGFDKAFYFEAHLPDKGTWYRVGLGAYGNKIEAERAGHQLQGRGDVPSFIIQRIGE